MQIVIDIPKKLYDRYKEKDYIKRCDIDEFEKALDSCIILPKGHGRLIDADALDEAIKHCEEVAEEKERQVKEGAWEKDSNTEKQCNECAKEHRQLAEWLRALKEIWDSGDCNNCLHQNNCTIRPKPGQLARFNCYQYERGIQNDNDNN